MNRESPLSPEVWERTPPEAQAYIRALEARVVMLEATVQRLEAVVQHWEALVQQLREQLQQDSRTSSRPPSSDPPQASAKRSRRGPSGQPGHAGQARALVPVDAVDVVRPVKPERCQRCQHPLSGEDPQPERHQVTEIPPVKPVITEYQLHQLICLACGAATRGEVPVGVPTDGPVPFLLDMATSVVAEGKVRVKRNRGEKVPEGWLLDNQGRPTTDPTAFYQEPRGAILPLGGSAGHKGFGLGMVVEILSGILARAGYAREGADRFSNGTFIVVIDISAFVDPAEFRTETDALLRYIKSAPKALGVEAILYPGEPELAEQQKREREGITLEDETWNQILALAQELGIAIAAKS